MSSRGRTVRKRNALFTFQLDGEDDIPSLFDDLRTLHERVVVTDPLFFLACQVEEAPTTGHLHLQLFVRCTKQYTTIQFKELFASCGESHIELFTGKAAIGIAYCTKLESRFYIGDECFQLCLGVNPSKNAGARTDRLEVRALVSLAIKEHHRLPTVVEAADNDYISDHAFGFIVRNLGNYAKLEGQVLAAIQVAQLRTVVFLHGPTGTGKSYFAHNLYAGHTVSLPDPTLKWSVPHGDVVVLDDVDSTAKPDTQRLKTFCDPYKNQWAIKSGFTPVVWSLMFITSNETLERVFADAPPVHFAAIKARINHNIDTSVADWQQPLHKLLENQVTLSMNPLKDVIPPRI